MKKLLLIITLCTISFNAFSQSFIQEKLTGYKYYDKGVGYVNAKVYIAKYGEDVWIQNVLLSHKNGEISSSVARAILTGHSIPKDALKLDNGESQYKPTVHQSKTEKYGPLRMRPVNLVVGTSIIGLSTAGYMVSIESCNANIRSKNKEIGRLNEKIASLGANVPHDKSKLQKEVDDLYDKIDRIDKGKTVATYICAGTSIVGVVVVLTGLHRDGYGVPIAKNMYIDSKNTDVSLSFKF